MLNVFGLYKHWTNEIQGTRASDYERKTNLSSFLPLHPRMCTGSVAPVLRLRPCPFAHRGPKFQNKRPAHSPGTANIEVSPENLFANIARWGYQEHVRRRC